MKPAHCPDPTRPDTAGLITRRTALTAPLLMTACAHTPTLPREQALALALPGRATPLRAWLHLPRGYGDETRGWPLLVFLHGSGERGDDLDRVKVHGPPKHAAAGRDYPFILCSPLLEANADWHLPTLHALLGALRAGWRVDTQRITATGLSRGGHGVWRWAAAYPNDLAAIAPVCGYADPSAVCRARHVPVRAYHGDADTVVPLAEQQACVDALRDCGGTVSFIIYPGVGHDAWTPAYDDPALVPWLMAQRRA
ncbi:MAG: dienelactone hydrolase family protein [Rubrivivax sp.]|nr:dienelactone hydrolase family protein [Rubrivivax sp.]